MCPHLRGPVLSPLYRCSRFLSPLCFPPIVFSQTFKSCPTSSCPWLNPPGLARSLQIRSGPFFWASRHRETWPCPPDLLPSAPWARVCVILDVTLLPTAGPLHLLFPPLAMLFPHLCLASFSFPTGPGLDVTSSCSFSGGLAKAAPLRHGAAQPPPQVL